MRELFLLTPALLVAVTGCAATPQGAPQSAAGDTAAADTRILQDPEPADGRAQAIYEVLVAEIAGKLGSVEDAVSYYLEAARRSRDPGVAERATRIALYAERYDAALQGASVWTELQPDRAEPRQVLVALYVETGQPEQAQPHLDYLLEAAKGGHSKGYAIIVALLSKSANTEAALDAAQLLAERHGDEPRSHHAYASLAFDAERYDAALAAVDRALELDPEFLEARALRARVLLARGEQEQALQTMAEVVETSDSERLRLMYARMLVEAGRYAQARDRFQELVADSPEDADLLYSLALLSLEMDQYGQARDYLKRVVDTGQRTSEAHYYLGRIAQSQERYEMAVSWYLRVDQGQYRIDAQVRTASLLAELGRLEQARQHLVTLRSKIEEDETRIRLYQAEGQLLSNHGRPEAAVEVYNDALMEHPGHPDLLYARALTAAELGRMDRVEADLRAVLEQDPDNASALNALGYTLANQTDRYREALGYIKRALEQEPEDPAVIDSMGWVQYRLGNYERAEHYLRRAHSMLDDPEIASHLVQVLWKRGKNEEARELLRKQLEASPDSPELNALREQIGL